MKRVEVRPQNCLITKGLAEGRGSTAPVPARADDATPSQVRVGRLLGWSAIALVWLLCGAIAVAGSLEVALYINDKWVRNPQHPRYAQLVQAYQPFTVQHINPHFLFFFPFDLQSARRSATRCAESTMTASGDQGRARLGRGNSRSFWAGRRPSGISPARTRPPSLAT
jgi:hypothetical protein